MRERFKREKNGKMKIEEGCMICVTFGINEQELVQNAE